MEPASNSHRMTGSLSNAHDSRMPGAIHPYGDPDASSVRDYYMPWVAEQHYFTASPGPHNTNTFMFPANSAHSRTPVATGEAYFFASSSTVDSAPGPSTVHDMELSESKFLSPVSPVSPFIPLTSVSGVNYFSGDGFMSRDVWTGTEINPEPSHDHLFSPPPAAGLPTAAPGAIASPPRPRRSWFPTSKTGPPTQITQRQKRIGPRSPKATRSIPPRRQHEDGPSHGGGSNGGSGDGDESANAVKDGHLRRTHNLVEKQYRNRLNAHFERLLAVLPARFESQEEQGRGDHVPNKSISKAEVLGMATLRIRTLEQENRELLARQDQLTRDLETTSGATPFCMNPMLGQAPY